MPHTITAESFAPGVHAVVVMPECSLEEALSLAINARLSELTMGCHVSPPMMLAHAGYVASVAVDDLDETVLR